MGNYAKELKHWRERLRIAENDLEALTSGQRKMAEDRGDGWVDATEQWIEKLRSQVLALEQLIVAYELLEATETSPSNDDPTSKREEFPEAP